MFLFSKLPRRDGQFSSQNKLFRIKMSFQFLFNNAMLYGRRFEYLHGYYNTSTLYCKRHKINLPPSDTNQNQIISHKVINSYFQIVQQVKGCIVNY